VASQRHEIVDFLRGVAILDMILVHYSAWLDSLRLGGVGKLIRYTDFAVEAFILLAGFIIGSHYLAKFQVDEPSVIRILLQRAGQIIGIQYVMIATLSIPVALVAGQTIMGADSIWQFGVKSFLFLNQVPLLHILPTFVPLFLLSVPLLFALKRDWDIVVAVLSVSLFAFGQWQPYLPLDFAENAIFPPVLWQLYFVSGMLLGKYQVAVRIWLKLHGRWNVLLALIGFLIMAFVYHGHHWIPAWGKALEDSQLVVRKFPLNWLGLLCHGSILYLLIAVTTFTWPRLTRLQTVVSHVSRLGRNSLVLFIVHVYVCFVVTYLFDRASLVALSIIGLNIVGSFWISRILDAKTEIHARVVAHRNA
jgi:hypothetical protein